MACIGQVLSILPIPDIMNYLDAILVPRLDHMQQLVKQEVSELPPAWHMGDEVLPDVMSCGEMLPDVMMPPLCGGCSTGSSLRGHCTSAPV